MLAERIKYWTQYVIVANGFCVGSEIILRVSLSSGKKISYSPHRPEKPSTEIPEIRTKAFMEFVDSDKI